MKCLYAIPTASGDDAEALCAAYAKSLETLSQATLTLADAVRALAESTAAAVLKVDDDDWAAVQGALEAGGEGALAGELFWSGKAVRRALGALTSDSTGAIRTIESWLKGQLTRDRSVVLLAN